MKKIKRFNESMSTLTYNDARQLWSEIESQGFGYWIQNYGYEGTDEKLTTLCKKAKSSMDELENYIENLFAKVGFKEGIS